MNWNWIVEMAYEGSVNLLRHKVRSLLTLLGIMFGVSAVITMMAIGEGGQQTILKEIEGLGLGNVIIDSTKPLVSNLETKSKDKWILSYGLTFKDVEQLFALFPAGCISLAQDRYSLAHLVNAKVYFRGARREAKIFGVESFYFRLFRTELIRGKLLADLQSSNQDRVAVITEQLAQDLPAINGPVGQMIQIGRYKFEIIGVVRIPEAERGSNRQIFIPYQTAKYQYGRISTRHESGSFEGSRMEIGRLVIHFSSPDIVLGASKIIERVLNQNHPSHDFTMRIPLNELKAQQKIKRTFNSVLIAVAAISLLVGGIGIMNVMLAIVMERIPEIGIRRAVGASRIDILRQFLAESIVLSTAGGILGCLLGALAVPLASQLTDFKGIITPSAVIISIAVSWLVGVIFGFAPASRAANLDPVECLRSI
jgi:putative ABC transport system permease protein